MWDPNSADKHFNLSIQFNKQVSADGYARVRDQVILTQGVKIVSEDTAARTMNIEYNDDVAGKLRAIAGVESASKVRISGFGNSGGCFGPRGRGGRGW